MKGYNLYDITSKQILVSRDEIFLEEIFSFHYVISLDKLVHFHPDLVLPIPSLKNSPASQSLTSTHPILHDDAPTPSHDDDFETPNADLQNSISSLSKLSYESLLELQNLPLI